MKNTTEMSTKRNMSHDPHFSCAIANCTFNLIMFFKAGTAKVFRAQYNAFLTILAVFPWDFAVVVAYGLQGWWWSRGRRG